MDKLEPGDPLSGEFVKIYWTGQLIGNRRTNFMGLCSVDCLVPSTHELGVVNNTFDYEGPTLHDPAVMSF